MLSTFKVHRHAVQESIDQVPFDTGSTDHVLETMQDRVQTDVFFNCKFGICSESVQQFLLRMFMERIHDLIRETNESINGVDLVPESPIKQTHS